MKRFVFVTATIVLLAACSSGGLHGTFADDSGLSVLTFKSGDTIIMSAMDIKIEMKYTVKDNKVLVTEPNGVVTELEFDGADTLTGQYGLKYTRKKK